MPGYTEEQERLARQAGFRNAEEAVLFQRQKSRNLKPSEASTASGSGGLSILERLFAWHPKVTIGRAANVLNSANRRR